MKSSTDLMPPVNARITFDCSSGWLALRRPVLEPFLVFVGTDVTLKTVASCLAGLASARLKL